jgi:hypothetical protein
VSRALVPWGEGALCRGLLLLRTGGGALPHFAPAKPSGHCPSPDLHSLDSPGTSNAAVAAFSTSILGVAPYIDGAWQTALDAITTGVNTLGSLQGGSNPLTGEQAQCRGTPQLAVSSRACHPPVLATN